MVKQPVKKVRIYGVLIFIVFAAIGLFIFIAKKNAIPVLMYHNISTDPNECNSMTITQQRLREDLEYLRAQGYTALLPEELVKIHKGEASMPQKPVLITFDDGYLSNYEYAYPLLRETGMKAVISVIAGNIREQDEGSPVFMTWAQLRELYESGIIDIGCHTYALHNNDNGGIPHPDGHDGIQRLSGETRENYQIRVGGDLHHGVTQIRERVGNVCIYFSYPFGANDNWFDPLLKEEGICVTTSTMQRTATILFGTLDLPRWRVTMDTPVSSLLP